MGEVPPRPSRPDRGELSALAPALWGISDDELNDSSAAFRLAAAGDAEGGASVASSASLPGAAASADEALCGELGDGGALSATGDAIASSAARSTNGATPGGNDIANTRNWNDDSLCPASGEQCKKTVVL